MTLKAQIIEEDGKPKFAVLPYDSFQNLAEELTDFESIEDFLDYLRLLRAKAETTKWHTREEVWKELGLGQ